jgi:hypothetical protein
LGGSAILPQLLGYLHDENVDVRTQAATAVGESNSVSALGVLVELLHDPSYWVRAAAASYMARLTDIYPGGDGIFWPGEDPAEVFSFWSERLTRNPGSLKIHPIERDPEPIFVASLMQ